MCSHIRIFTYLCLSGVYPMIGLYIWSKSLVCRLRKVCNNLIMNFIVDLFLSFTYFFPPRNVHCCRSIMQGRRKWRWALFLGRTEDWICFPWCICLGARRMVHPHPFLFELASAPLWMCSQLKQVSFLPASITCLFWSPAPIKLIIGRWSLRETRWFVLIT